MAFNNLVQPTTKRPRSFGRFSMSSKDSPFRQNLTVESWLLVGAFLQTLLCLVLPIKYALVPGSLLLGFRILDTVLITNGFIKNPYLKNVITKKFSPQVPDTNGDFKPPGTENVAVLLLGTKVNHPLGLLAPHFKQFGEFATKMYADLDRSEGQKNGFLGWTSWTRTDENGAVEMLGISYWRSIDDVHAFSQSQSHLDGLRWWAANIKELDHIGIMHEIFEAPAGMWESVYKNFQPTLLAKTAYIKRDGKLEGGQVGEQWISPIIEAKGALKTSNGRRGLALSKGSEAKDYD